MATTHSSITFLLALGLSTLHPVLSAAITFNSVGENEVSQESQVTHVEGFDVTVSNQELPEETNSQFTLNYDETLSQETGANGTSSSQTTTAITTDNHSIKFSAIYSTTNDDAETKLDADTPKPQTEETLTSDGGNASSTQTPNKHKVIVKLGVNGSYSPRPQLSIVFFLFTAVISQLSSLF